MNLKGRMDTYYNWYEIEGESYSYFPTDGSMAWSTDTYHRVTQTIAHNIAEAVSEYLDTINTTLTVYDWDNDGEEVCITISGSELDLRVEYDDRLDYGCHLKITLTEDFTQRIADMGSYEIPYSGESAVEDLAYELEQYLTANDIISEAAYQAFDHHVSEFEWIEEEVA